MITCVINWTVGVLCMAPLVARGPYGRSLLAPRQGTVAFHLVDMIHSQPWELQQHQLRRRRRKVKRSLQRSFMTSSCSAWLRRRFSSRIRNRNRRPRRSSAFCRACNSARRRLRSNYETDNWTNCSFRANQSFTLWRKTDSSTRDCCLCVV